MSEKVTQQSVSEGEMDLWHRIIAKRRAEWSKLPSSLLTPLWDIEAPGMEINDPWQRTEFILKTHFTISVDRKIEPKKRRTAWRVVSTLLQKLDNARGRAVSQQRQTAAPKMAIQALISSSDLISQTSADLNQSKKPRSLQSNAPTAAQESLSTTSIATVAAVQEQSRERVPQQLIQQQKKPSATQNEPVTLSGFLSQPQQNQRQQQSVQQQQQQQQQPSAARSKPADVSQAPSQQQKRQNIQKRQQLPAVQSEPVPLSSTKPASVDVVPARATPTPPTSSVVTQQPEASNGKSVGSKGSAFSSTAKVVPETEPKKAAPPPRILPPISISFGADTQKYAAAVDKNGRSSVRVTIQPRQIPTDEYARTLKRFEQWDRYWKIERVISVVETFPISRLDNLQAGTRPQQATECTIKLDPSDVSRVRDWGRPVARDKKYSHGETRLLVRMLPVKLGKKKRPRADTHLWPKGTFVQLGGMPVFIDQRRQQQHDLNEWKSMAAPLDLSSLVRNPTNCNKLQLYCLDNEPYILCVALCSYVAPETLNSIVWSNDVKKLSMDDAKAMALENAKKNTVSLLDDFTSNSNEMSSFIFPLCCPISQQLIQTPVRGTACNHWQCFELSNFVESNAHVTGTRWECPVCTKILSLHDLQYCPLTASILKQYTKEASPHRDRIQFFANGTWKLLDEAKKRYSKKRPAEGGNMNGNKKARSDGVAASKSNGSSPEVIEIE